MKCYVGLLFVLSTNILVGMEDSVTVIPFRNLANPNDDTKNFHDMNEKHGIPMVSSLDELKNFLQYHPEQGLLDSLESLKENLKVKPEVFVEHYFAKHTFQDLAQKEIVQSKIHTVLAALDSDSYCRRVLDLVSQYKPSTDGSISFRNKPIHSPEAHDPVDLLNVAKKSLDTLDTLVTEELAKDNADLKKTNEKQSLWSKTYQGIIAVLTVLSVVVPTVQQFLGNASEANGLQPLVNCSSV